jgi:hypothetical protein
MALLLCCFGKHGGTVREESSADADAPRCAPLPSELKKKSTRASADSYRCSFSTSVSTEANAWPPQSREACSLLGVGGGSLRVRAPFDLPPPSAMYNVPDESGHGEEEQEVRAG